MGRNVPFSLWEQSSTPKQIALIRDNLSNSSGYIFSTEFLLMVVWNVGGILFEGNYATGYLVGCDR